MRLLVLTQKVDANDDVLGFFHEWLRRFAARCEQVEVICLFEGAHQLPQNMRVHSLGKERGVGRVGRALRLYRYLWRLRGQYDAVFVHMNPEYLVLAGWLWRLLGIRTVLWYSHRRVDAKLRLAARLVDVIATSARSSFQLATDNIHMLGHGIDTDFFAPAPRTSAGPWQLVSVGRLTPIKRLLTAIEALAQLRARGVDAELTLVGQAATPGDRAYEVQLKERVAQLQLEPFVHFAGAAAYPRMPEVYHRADASLNLAPTGGLDKAVFESMACGLPTFASNEGFKDCFGPYTDRLQFAQDNPADLAGKLAAMYHAEDRPALGAYLRKQVIARAGLDRLIDSLMKLLWPPK